jgi:hypothetical protein
MITHSKISGERCKVSCFRQMARRGALKAPTLNPFVKTLFECTSLALAARQHFDSPLQGFGKLWWVYPGRCPGLWLARPFGAALSAKGAIQPQPRPTAWGQRPQKVKALKGRTKMLCTIREGFSKVTLPLKPFAFICVHLWLKID